MVNIGDDSNIPKKQDVDLLSFEISLTITNMRYIAATNCNAPTAMPNLVHHNQRLYLTCSAR